MKLPRKRFVQLMNNLNQIERVHCKPCEKRIYSSDEPIVTCKNCPWYTEIRAIGDELAPKKSKKESQEKELNIRVATLADRLSVEEYAAYKQNGDSDDVIAELLEVSWRTIMKWKSKHKESIDIINLCKVSGCDSKYYCKGYCVKHYRQIKRHGKVIDNINNKSEGRLNV